MARELARREDRFGAGAFRRAAPPVSQNEWKRSGQMARDCLANERYSLLFIQSLPLPLSLLRLIPGGFVLSSAVAYI